MSQWPEVRRVLKQLSDDPRRPLLNYPDPRTDNRPPPYWIGLQPWAVDIAADLTRRLADDVDLTVGLLHYRECRRIPLAGAEMPSLLPPEQ